jgi:RNA polymerase sigma-70 factor (ECF subfamily)
MTQSVLIPDAHDACRVAVLSDEQLLLQYRASHDDGLFRELVHRYERPLYVFLCRYTRDCSLAEDLLQSTFLRLHQRIDLYEAGRPVRPWIYSIAAHLAVDALRKALRRRATSLDSKWDENNTESGRPLDLLKDKTPQPLQQVSDDERSNWAHRAVMALPNYLREVVSRIYFEGQTYQEATEVMQLPLGTIKSRMHVALVKLRSAWRKSHRDPNEE